MARAIRTISTAACLLAFGLAGLTACSDNPPEGTVLGDDTQSPSPTSSTPTNTPTPTPPTITPTTGESETRTLVRQYVALRNYAFETGNVKPMLKFAAEGCQSCQGNAELIRGVYEAGGKFVGSPDERIVELEGDQKRLLVITKYEEWGKVASPDAEPEMYEPGQRTSDYILKREGNQWKVAEIRVYQS